MDKQTESLARQEFEKWLRSQPHVLNVGVSESGSYVLREDRIAWSAWKASRESLVVELPQRQSLCASGYGDGYFVPNDFGEGLEYDETVEAIRAIGIRIKGEGV